MSLVDTHTLSGSALDWAVAKCEGYSLTTDGISKLVEKGSNMLILGHATCLGEPCGYSPSTRWDQGGPIIIERGISFIRCDNDYAKDVQGFTTPEVIPVWAATKGQHSWTESTEHQGHDPMYQIYTSEVIYGSSPLIASMRCYVASKLGNKVDIPSSLIA